MDWKHHGIYLVGGILIFESVRKCVDILKQRYWAFQESEIKFARNINKICKGHVFSKTICSKQFKTDYTFQCSYSIILWMVEFFDSARKSLDISIYLVTCEALRDAILRAYCRGVKIRVFTDYTMAKGSGSAIEIFIKSGIPVKMMTQSRMMHRKSAIVDKSRLLMGSGNWTMQALAGNWDLWYQTSVPNVVRDFMEEFETQWAMENCIQPTLEQFENIKLGVQPGPGFAQPGSGQRDEKVELSGSAQLLNRHLPS